MMNKNKYLIKKAGMVVLMGLLSTQNVFAGLVFVTEENAVNSDNFIIDFDDNSTDFIDLEFGDALTSRLRYDIANDKFIVNENLDFESNELLNARVENLAAAPTCDGTKRGQVYHNTTDNGTYVCDGSTWNQIDGGVGGHTQNTDTGTDSENFTLDTDNTGGDLSLTFGTTLNETLTWDSTNTRFNLSDDLNLGNNEIQGVRIENLAVAPTCDGTNGGHIYFNTADKLTYTCDGTSTWNPLENALNTTVEFPVVEAKRTTSYTLTTGYADVDLDTTQLENDVSTLDHDDTLRDRINIGSDGMYQIIYGYTAGGSATATHEARARVRANDTTVLAGSASVNKNYQGEFSTTSASFISHLNDGDYVSLQLQRDATTDITQDEIYFSIIKLEGVKGEKGDQGDPGVDGDSSGITDSETFTLDNDNTGGDLSLVFGNTLNETLTWNNTSLGFDLSDDLNVTGNVTVGGTSETIDTDGGVFSLTGDDIFVADSLGVEGAIYTDDTATKYEFIDIYGCIRGSASAGTVSSGRSGVVRFDVTNASQMRCVTTVPDDWVSGTDIDYEIFWSPSDNTAGDLFLEFDHASFGVGDDISTSFTDTNLPTEAVSVSTQSEIYSLTATIPSADITAGEIQNFRFRRNPGNVADTYAGDINIHMIRLSYTGKKLK